MNILVTGAGALLGQGILRCLRLSENKYKVITADPNPLSSGNWLGDKAYIIPIAKDEAYIPAIERIISEEGIDVVLVGTDVELPKFAQYRDELESKYGTRIVVASTQVIDIANNKWLTAEFLRTNNFPYPLSALTTDKDALMSLKSQAGLPLIAKPVDGARSVGFEIIKSEERLNQITSHANNLVVQEYLSNDEGEYTSGCIVYGGKCKAIVTLKRDLRDGNTYRTYRDADTNKYDHIIIAIAEKLGVSGPCNFQFRIKDHLPVIFEINSRFSGTTPLRCFYGLNEVEAIIEFLINEREIKQVVLKEGIVMRAYADIMISNEEIENFKEKGHLDNPNCEQFSFRP